MRERIPMLSDEDKKEILEAVTDVGAFFGKAFRDKEAVEFLRVTFAAVKQQNKIMMDNPQFTKQDVFSRVDFITGLLSFNLFERSMDLTQREMKAPSTASKQFIEKILSKK